MSSPFSEDSLVEQPAIALFAEQGWETANCYDEYLGRDAPPSRDAPAGRLYYLGRETSNEVILLSRLQPAMQRLNPQLPAEAFQLAIQELTRERSLVSAAHANREVYLLLKDGVKVAYRDPDGTQTVETVRLIDWENPLETISSSPPSCGFPAITTSAAPTCWALSTASRWSLSS